MRVLLPLLAAVLLMPVALAQDVPTPVRCNTAYCFSVLDEDGDGAPDGVLGGTAEVVHGAPTAYFGSTREGSFAAGEALVGDEEEGGYMATLYVGHDANATYVEVIVWELDGETGSATPKAGTAVLVP